MSRAYKNTMRGVCQLARARFGPETTVSSVESAKGYIVAINGPKGKLVIRDHSRSLAIDHACEALRALPVGETGRVKA